MRHRRLKRDYIPSLDAMERRELLSAGSLAAAPLRGVMALVSEPACHKSEGVGPSRAPFAVRGASAHRTPGRASSAGVGILQLQSDVAITYLRLADSALERLLRLDARFEPAATQLRRTITELTSQGPSRTSGALTASSSEALESILSTLGPGDPFASLPIVATSSLKPGDMIVRCTPGLSSQGIELMNWTRYSHVALYIGRGQVIDAMANGVHTRSLSELLSESNRVGVLRVPGLTAAQARTVVLAAKSHEGAAYNFPGVGALATQKLIGVIAHAGEGLGGIIGLLSRAERLPSRFVNNGKFGCSQLVRAAYLRAGIVLSHANGLAPGDVVRLGMVGLLDEVGRLAIPAPATSPTGVWEL